MHIGASGVTRAIFGTAAACSRHLCGKIAVLALVLAFTSSKQETRLGALAGQASTSVDLLRSAPGTQALRSAPGAAQRVAQNDRGQIDKQRDRTTCPSIQDPRLCDSRDDCFWASGQCLTSPYLRRPPDPLRELLREVPRAPELPPGLRIETLPPLPPRPCSASSKAECSADTACQWIETCAGLAGSKKKPDCFSRCEQKRTP